MRIRFRLLSLLGVAAATVVAGLGGAPASADNTGNQVVNGTEGDLPAVVRGNTWFLRTSLTTGPADVVFAYGDPSDTPLFGDWDGDGDKTPGVVRGNTWYLRNENSVGVADVVFAFGQPGDTFVAGDWNGDRVDTPGVVRGNHWFLRNENTTGIAQVAFDYGNTVGDKPIVGDWDGDGDANPGVVRPPGCSDCNDEWFLRTDNTTGGATIQPFAAGIAAPVPGDWNGDRMTTAGWTDRGVWFLHDANRTGPTSMFTFGNPGDRPLVWSR